MAHLIKSLPKWAQKEFHKKDLEIERLQSLAKAHEILENKSWSTLPLNGAFESGDYRRLYLIDKDMITPLCSIGKNDTILIGRDKLEVH